MPALKIAILSRGRKLYSTRRMREVAEARGHTVQVIDPLRCCVSVRAGQPELYGAEGERLEGFDAVIPRIGASVTYYGLAVLRQFEMMGVYSLNESAAIGRSRDKLRALQLLSRDGVSVPPTTFANSGTDSASLIKLAGGTPLVIKLVEGSQGSGVVLAETDSAAQSVIGAFLELKANILVQQFVKEARGADLRCLVVNDRVVGAMVRQAKPGEFRSNIHLGASARGARPTPAERAVALQAVRTIGLTVAGVDIIRAKDGPMVLEINSSPGLEGIETATGHLIAEKIIQLIERNARKRKRKKATG